MENIKEIFQQTIELLNSRFIRHQYMSFPSGAIMLDIWYEGKFYVIQFQDYVGVSEITEENPGFDTIPDERFYTNSDYQAKLAKILQHKTK